MSASVDKQVVGRWCRTEQSDELGTRSCGPGQPIGSGGERHAAASANCVLSPRFITFWLKSAGVRRSDRPKRRTADLTVSVGSADASTGTQLSLGYRGTVSRKTRRLEAHSLKVLQGFAPLSCPGRVLGHRGPISQWKRFPYLTWGWLRVTIQARVPVHGPRVTAV
jgi:hypothetical protein